jgi:TPP-dependent pyruvate/acetoin dehydrogenase alpha subunit
VVTQVTAEATYLEAVRAALEDELTDDPRGAHRGGGPTLIEAATMRMDGHAVHDDASYVPRELLDEWRARDPIDRLAAELRGRGVAELRLQEDWRAARDEVEAAVERAWSAPGPTGDDIDEGVFA